MLFGLFGMMIPGAIVLARSYESGVPIALIPLGLAGLGLTQWYHRVWPFLPEAYGGPVRKPFKF